MLQLSKHFLTLTQFIDTVPDLPPITNVTEEENCGVSGTTGAGCELSYQPCFYNVTVGTVYKGNLAVSLTASVSVFVVNACLPNFVINSFKPSLHSVKRF